MIVAEFCRIRDSPSSTSQFACTAIARGVDIPSRPEALDHTLIQMTTPINPDAPESHAVPPEPNSVIDYKERYLLNLATSTTEVR
jgi:hypothetical protein